MRTPSCYDKRFATPTRCHADARYERPRSAHHSVLIVPVLGAHAKDVESGSHRAETAAEPVHALNRISPRCRRPAIGPPRALHDVNEKLDEVRQLFTLGYLPLAERALAESLY
jgi:arginine decarboxylase-like protein